MNKLIIPNGGMPLFGDDFNFLDSASRDAFKGISREIVDYFDGNLILGGCEFEISGSNIIVQPGHVMLDYEIRFFPGATVPTVPIKTYVFTPDDFYDSTGLKSFANASSQNTYQVRRAKLTLVDDIPGQGLYYNAASRLSDAIYALLSSKTTASTTMTVHNGWSKEAANEPILKKTYKTALLEGGFGVGTISQVSFTKIATIFDSAYRPARRFKTVVAAYGTGVFGNIMLEFFTNGEIYAIATSADSWSLISVNIPFSTP